MGRGITGYFKKICLAAAVLSIVISAAACSSGPEDSKEKQPESRKEETQASKSDKEQGEIPDELLPGSTNGDDAPGDTKSGGAEITEEGAVYQAGSGDGGSSPAGEASSAGKETSKGQSSGKSKIQVSFSVDSSAAEEYGYSVYFSSQLSLEKGATVYDALAASGVDYSGSSYIASIGGLAEKACGGLSGWKYYVNGSESGKACNKYVLQDGDVIKWSYVLKP